MSDTVRPPAAGPALSIEHLLFSYPGAAGPVLRDVSLELESGAFALLVGGTGSGKSTLLSLMKPEIAPAGECAGSISVFGRPVGDMDSDASARTIGFVFQNPDNQIVCESVWHEMAFGLENLGFPQGEMRRRIAETSYFFGMEDWFRRDTDTLSGGRKQLLALASVLVMRPRLLLLDEPTAQLDPIAERNFLHALFRVNRELGCTVVVATHRPQAMTDYATCCYRLTDGRVEEVDLAAVASPSSGGGAMANFEAMNDDIRSHVSKTEFPQVDDVDKSEAVHDSCIASKNARKIVHSFKNRHVESGGQKGAATQGRAARLASFVVGGRTANQAACAVDFSAAWFRYDRDGDWVLRGLDLRVERGEIHALVGGNGCGKSTLLSLMAGTQKLQRGALRIGLAERALLPQDPRALFAAETVEGELMEWAKLGPCGRDEAVEMLRRLELTSRAGLHPYDLSGGQQQLLALGKLLLVKPRLLLLDEPTKGLDDSACRKVAAVLRALRAEGVTVVMATHDLAFARDVADSVSMVFDGEVACTETAPAFFADNLYYRS